MAADHRLLALKAFDGTKAGVKGLVDAGVTAVPSIFHHQPDHRHRHFTVPVIDLSSMSSRRPALVAQVKAAAETVGFFQVVNHGVPEGAMSAMLAAVRSFNEEPVEAKAPYYTRDPGRRVRYQSNVDLFTSPAAQWRDTLFMEMPAEPQELPAACRGVAPEYAGLVQQRLGRTLLELFSEALGLPRGYLEEEQGCLEGVSVAGHYYPACPEPHLTLGTTSHSDCNFLTVLLQDAVGGLRCSWTTATKVARGRTCRRPRARWWSTWATSCSSCPTTGSRAWSTACWPTPSGLGSRWPASSGRPARPRRRGCWRRSSPTVTATARGTGARLWRSSSGITTGSRASTEPLYSTTSGSESHPKCIST